MLWMKWMQGEPVTIITKVPLPCRTGLRSSWGWFLGPDGILRQVCTGPAAILMPYPLVLPTPWGGRPSQARGDRPKGPARLTGVLHYFTRGPD